MPWYTLTDGFDVDFGVDEWHGTNAFIPEGDRLRAAVADATPGSTTRFSAIIDTATSATVALDQEYVGVEPGVDPRNSLLGVAGVLRRGE